jgi:hypothetical protein
MTPVLGTPNRRESDVNGDSDDSDVEEFVDGEQSPARVASPGIKQSLSKDHDRYGMPIRDLMRGSVGSYEAEFVQTNEPLRQRLAQTMGISKRQIMIDPDDISFQDSVMKQQRVRMLRIMAISTCALFTGISIFVLIVAHHNDGFENFFSAVNTSFAAMAAFAIGVFLIPSTFLVIGLSLILCKQASDDGGNKTAELPYIGKSMSSRSVSSSLSSVFRKSEPPPPGPPIPKKEEPNLAIGADIC